MSPGQTPLEVRRVVTWSISEEEEEEEEEEFYKLRPANKTDD